jgi:hypothetical protein
VRKERRNKMKKVRLIGLVIVVLGLLVAGSAAPVLAHGSDDSTTSGYSGVYLDSPTLIRLAQTLELTPEELSSHLQAGETLAEIAQEQNVPEEQLIEAIVAPYADQLTLRVRYGYINQEQVDVLFTEAKEHARTLINQDLSGSRGSGDYSDMQEDCNQMMGGGYGSSRWGGMMGGMMGPGSMMGGWGSYGYQGYDPDDVPSAGRGFGGMMGSWGQSFNRGWNNMMNGFGGWGGGMDDSMMGGW